MPSASLKSILLAALVLAACGTTPADSTPDAGTAAKVAITSVEPAGTIALGSEIRLLGKGFGTPAAGTVTFDASTSVTQFKAGSDDTHLVFDVPAVPGIPATGGKEVTLTFSNAAGAASTKVTLVQAQPTVPEGTLRISYARPPRTRPPSPGGGGVLNFEVKAITNMDETFTVTPIITNGWTAQILGDEGSPITELTLEKGAPPVGTVAAVQVQFSVPDTAAEDATADLMLVVTSKKNPALSGWSGLVHIALGDWPLAAPMSTGCTEVSPRSTVQSGVIEAPVGQKVELTFSVAVGMEGHYTRAITIENDPDHLWTLEADSGDVTIAASGDVDLHAAVTAAKGAPDAQLKVRLVSVDDEEIYGEAIQQIRIPHP